MDLLDHRIMKNGYVIMSSDGWTLTVKEKTLLHLFDFFPPSESFEKPFALTQEGIASAVGIMRSAVPRAMKELIGDEMVESTLAHVKGLKRRRKCYILSQKGYRATRDMVRRLKGVAVDMQEEEGGGITEGTLGDCLAHLKRRTGLIGIIRELESNGVVHLFQVEEVEPVAEERKTGQMQREGSTSSVPRTRYFYGREKELKELTEAFDAGSRFVVVYGIAGIGKTTLAARFAVSRTKKGKVFWHRFYSWDDRRSLLLEMAEFLNDQGITELKEALRRNPRLEDLPIVSRTLVDIMAQADVLLVLDDLHMASPEVIELLGMLKNVSDSFERARFLVCSREKRGFYDVRDSVLRRKVREIELRGLDRDSIRSLRREITSTPVDDHELSLIMKLSKGHPLAVELMVGDLDGCEKAVSSGELSDFLECEIFQKLSAEEKSLLRFLSVSRIPVETDCLFFNDRIERAGKDIEIERGHEGSTHDWETVGLLTGKKLITKNDNCLASHDVVKDFFYRRTPPSERREVHRKLAAFLYNGLNERISQGRENAMTPSSVRFSERDEERLLALFDHLLKAYDYHLIPPTVIRFSPVIPQVYRQEEISEILDGDFVSRLDASDRSVLHSAAGDIEARLGRDGKALGRYARSLSDLSRSVRDRSGAEQGVVSVKDPGTGYDVGEIPEIDDPVPFKEGWGNIRERFMEFHRMGDLLDTNMTRRVLETGMRICRLLLKGGRRTEARELFLAGAELARGRGIDELRADYLAGVGWAYHHMGDTERARDYYDRSLDALINCDNIPGAIRKNLSLGRNRAREGNQERAMMHFERCMNYFECERYPPGRGSTNARVGDNYLKMLLSTFSLG